MARKSQQVSIICTREEFDKVYSFLQASSSFACSHFETIKHYSESEDLSSCPVVVIDVDFHDEASLKLLQTLSKTCPGIRLVLTWDTDKSVYPENIPKIFYCVKKPFTQDKLLNILNSAFTKQLAKERRREPRVPVELPVELYCRTKFWIARTTNISLHGMQVAWDSNNIEEILESYGTDSEKISACRLFLEESIDFDSEHINISVNRRYTINQDNRELPTLMGFEFRDLDVDLRTKLQKVVIW